MKDWNNIEDRIRESLHKDYPYDEKLWQSAEKQLDVVFPSRSRKIGFYGIVITLIAVGSWLLWFLKPDHASTMAGVAEPDVTSHQDAGKQLLNNTYSESSVSVTDNEKENVTTYRGSASTSEAVHVKSKDEGNIENDRGEFTTKKEHVNDQATSADAVFQSATQASNITDRNENVVSDDNAITKLPDDNVDRIKGDPEVPDMESLKDFPDLKPDISTVAGAATNLLDFPHKRINLYTSLQWNTSLLSNGTAPGDDPEWNGSTSARNAIMQATDVTASVGVKKGRFNAQIGFGQTTFADRFTVRVRNSERVVVTDTLSSYFVLVNPNYKPRDRSVLLIREEYNINERLDTVTHVSTLYDQNDHISYWTVPVRVGFTLPMKRLELSAQAGVDYLFASRLKTSFTADTLFTQMIAQERKNDLRPSLLRMNLGLLAGYRMNYHVTVFTELRIAATRRNLYMSNTFGFRSADLGLGLRYRF